MVGTNTETIVREVSKLLTDPKAYRAMAKGISHYGDGKAAELWIFSEHNYWNKCSQMPL